MRALKINFYIVDIGFIIYWIITYFHLIPAQLLFPDYENKLLVIWNWSFLPLDALITISGITALALERKSNPLWKNFALMSLCFTMSSGLMAIAFWSIQGWFDISWWLPNLYLMLYPLAFLRRFLKPGAAGSTAI